MNFDPSQFGATPVSQSASPTIAFNPEKFGAVPAQETSHTFTPMLTPDNSGGPTFPSKDNESLVGGALRTIGNIPSSAIQFGKGLLKTLNPVDIAKNIADVFTPNENPEAPKVNVADVVKNLPESAYKTLVPQALQHLIAGNTEQAKKDIENDPVGTIAPFLLAAEGGAKVADNFGGLKTAAERNVADFGKTGLNVMPTKGIFEQGLDRGIKTATAPIIEPVKTAMSATGDFLGKVATSAASHITGLDTSTVENVVNSPEAFSKIAQDQVSRGGLGGEVKDAIDQRIADLSSVGKGYENIRNMEGAVAVPPSVIVNALAKHGIELVDGKVKVGTESIPLSTADVSALQHFVDTYGTETSLSNNAFLNTRKALSNMAKYDVGKTTEIKTVARSLRSAYDSLGKDQIPGLKELDALYAPETQFLKQVKRDYINPDGTFKDGAVNKIANATGVGKDNLLGRLEKVSPGISKRIKILKAVEDIEKARGIKVGTYGKIAVGAAGYALHGLPGLIVAEIIANPSIAVPLLRGLGYSKAKLIPILRALTIIAGDTSKFEAKGINGELKPTLQDLQDAEKARSVKVPVEHQPTDFVNKELPVIEMGKKPKIKGKTVDVNSEPKVISPFQRKNLSEPYQKEGDLPVIKF